MRQEIDLNCALSTGFPLPFYVIFNESIRNDSPCREKLCLEAQVNKYYSILLSEKNSSALTRFSSMEAESDNVVEVLIEGLRFLNQIESLNFFNQKEEVPVKQVKNSNCVLF